MNAIVTPNRIGQTFSMREQQGVLILEPRGDFGSLEWQGYADMESETLSTLDRFPCPLLVVDLSRVSYAGSEFVRLLLELRKRVQIRGGRIALAGIRREVAGILRTLRLEKILPQYPSTAKAIASISSKDR